MVSGEDGRGAPSRDFCGGTPAKSRCSVPLRSVSAVNIIKYFNMTTLTRPDHPPHLTSASNKTTSQLQKRLYEDSTTDCDHQFSSWFNDHSSVFIHIQLYNPEQPYCSTTSLLYLTEARWHSGCGLHDLQSRERNMKISKIKSEKFKQAKHSGAHYHRGLERWLSACLLAA